MGLLATVLGLFGCDARRASELQAGVSTEADVRARFGNPEKIWDSVTGARVFEYDRQPAGQTNYMITLGPDGKMTAAQQVLTPDNFARVQPGMMVQDVRRMLGRPAKITPYALKQEVDYDWRYLQPPNNAMVFTVTFDQNDKVLRTISISDPQAPGNRGGPD